MNELIPISELTQIAQSTDPYPVDFDEAWQWVGYTRKDHALEALKINFEQETDFCSRINGSKKEGRGGHNEVKYHLTTDCFKSFCMMAGTERGKEVRRYYLDIERQYQALIRGGNIFQAIQVLQQEITSLKASMKPSAPVYIPPPCHDLPDFVHERTEKAPLLSIVESFFPPIPIVQEFIDECCVREGTMTHLDTYPIFMDWQIRRGVKSIIDTHRFFKYLGLMGYCTKKKKNIFSVEGLSLRPGIVHGKSV